MKILTPELIRILGGDAEITSSAVTRNLEFQLGLMEKQIKRVAELAKFLPFADQQEEMNRLAKRLSNEAACLKFFMLGLADPDRKATKVPLAWL
jgi:hypothetical protein